MTVLRATEAECQRTVIDAAKLCGWLVHAERPAQSARGWRTPVQGHAGFPDLVLVHPTRGLAFIELKRRPNKVEDAQQAWLDVLGRHADARVWWVPEQLHELCQFLATQPRAEAS